MALDQIVQHAVRLVPHRLRGKVKSLPLVGAAQRLIVDRSLSGRVFVHTVDAGPAKGITFQVKLPEDKGIWTGTYEAAFADRLETEMRPGMVGYDIGAWHGYFSGIMLAGGASAVVAFDPLPDNRTRLDKMIALNPGSDVAIEPCALSDHEGTATLTLIDATSKAKLSDSPFEPDKPQGIDIEVALSTTDSVVA
ncbi:MAG: FkbM family methyltransferase, partial [Pseudomonadota bacterium]